MPGHFTGGQEARRRLGLFTSTWSFFLLFHNFLSTYMCIGIRLEDSCAQTRMFLVFILGLLGNLEKERRFTGIWEVSFYFSTFRHFMDTTSCWMVFRLRFFLGKGEGGMIHTRQFGMGLKECVIMDFHSLTMVTWLAEGKSHPGTPKPKKFDEQFKKTTFLSFDSRLLC